MGHGTRATGRPGPYLRDNGYGAVVKALQTPPGSRARRELFDNVEEQALVAEGEIASTFAKLNQIICSTDCLRLLGSLHSYDAFRRTHLSGPENFGSDAMLDFFAGLICSQQEVDILEAIDQPFDPSILYPVDSMLRDVANAQARIDMLETLRSSDSDIQGALNTLRLERHFDRMAGFDTHIHRIAESVFAIVDDTAQEEVGFRFSDALRFADLYGHRRMADVDRANQWMSENYPPLRPGASDEDRSSWTAGHLAWFGLVSAPAIELDVDEEASQLLEISLDSFTAMTQSMAVRVGTQNVTSPSSPNLANHRPLVMLSSGEWVWCRPVDFVQGVFDWAFNVASSSQVLLRKFDAARQKVAERLPFEVLSQVFGDHVHPNVAYPTDDAPAEVDALTTLPGANLVVECKGGRFSPQGRRGAPLRVEKHAKELIERAADQNARAVLAIENNADFRRNGRSLDFDPNGTNISIVVTFDRIDPFSTHLGTPSNNERSQRSWIVALADLIMIAEVLPTPSEFFAYAALRSGMVKDGQTMVFVEADALGAWLSDRLSKTTRISGVGLRDDAPIRMVSATSSWMNDYFSLEAMRRLGVDEEELAAWASDAANRQAERRPTPGVPEEVLSALSDLFADGDRLWAQRSREALSVLPSEWRVTKRMLRDSLLPAASLGRNAHKRLRIASEGFSVAGKLPIRLLREGENRTPGGSFLEIGPGAGT